MERGTPLFGNKRCKWAMKGNSFLEKVSRCCELIAKISLVALMLFVFTQIILRNIFMLGFPQLDESSRLAHLVLLFMMIPVLFAEEAHIKVEVLKRFLSPKADRLVNLISQSLSLGFVVIFMFSSVMLLESIWDVPTAALRIPSIILYAAPIAGIVFSGFFITNRITQAFIER